MNSEKSIESQLHKDAEHFNRPVDPSLRQAVMQRLEKASSSNTHRPSKKHVLFQYAMAASIALAVFIPMGLNYFSPETLKETHISGNQQAQNSNDRIDQYASEHPHNSMPNTPSETLVGSHYLTNEYQAILSDMEKLTQRLAQL